MFPHGCLITLYKKARLTVRGLTQASSVIKSCPASPRITMKYLSVFVGVTSVIVGLLAATSQAASASSYLCRQPLADDCPYGTVLDLCKRPVCLSGPGERCGGPADIMGTCAEGLTCKCGVCIGCSIIDMKCSLEEPVICNRF